MPVFLTCISPPDTITLPPIVTLPPTVTLLVTIKLDTDTSPVNTKPVKLEPSP